MTGAYLKSKRDISTLSVESAVAYFHRLAIRVSHNIRDTTVYTSPITNREIVVFCVCDVGRVVRAQDHPRRNENTDRETEREVKLFERNRIKRRKVDETDDG